MQRVEYIGNRGNPTFDGNLIALQARWIAFPVPPFVVCQCNACRQVQHRRLADRLTLNLNTQVSIRELPFAVEYWINDPFAKLAVLLHNLELLRVELAGLE